MKIEEIEKEWQEALHIANGIGGDMGGTVQIRQFLCEVAMWLIARVKELKAENERLRAQVNEYARLSGIPEVTQDPRFRIL